MRLGVAMVASIFHPSIGGIQSHTLHVSEKLRERGVDAFVVTRHVAGLPRYEEIRGVPTFRVGSPLGGWALSATSYVLEGLRCLVSRRDRWQVAHCHQMLSPMTLGLVARRFLGGRLVINPHACGPIGDVQTLRRGRPWTGAARLAAAIKSADAFVSVSRDIGEELRELGIEEARMWDIPNGVDIEHFQPASPAARRAMKKAVGFADGWTALYTGRLAHEKGLDVLIEAWPRVVHQRPDAQLIVVGGGPELERLCDRAEALRIENSVRFVGESSDVAPLLQAADAFVLPSRTEGCPVSLLEAMACGLPVVATRVGGMRQVMEDGVTGSFVPPEDPIALADKLLEVSHSPLAAAFGQRARRHMSTHYSLNAVADRYIEMYENLLSFEASSPSAIRRPAA